MRKEAYAFLTKLHETPSPSGFEQPVQRLIRRHVKRFADTIDTDVHGNLIVGLHPDGAPRVMLAGHCDQIGLMVKHIDDHGFLFFTSIGGMDPGVLPGARVTVHAQHGPIDGVIGRKPVHMMKQEERGARCELRDLWVDVGAESRKEAERVIRVGDPITFTLQVVSLGDNLISAPGLDNKSGTFVAMEVLRLCSARKMACALFAVSTVQEEIGLRGARTSCYGVNPAVGIAVDVTTATDHPDTDKRVFGNVRLGGGPVIFRGANINPKLEELLLSTAKAKRIPIQTAGIPGGMGTDANVMQLTRAGVATAAIGIPNRYMHTPAEVVSLSDLMAAAKLIAETVPRITPRVGFIPD